MHAQLNVDVVSGASQRAIAGQWGPETRSAVERIAVKSLRSDDLIAIEAGRLLEDVRMGLDSDLGTATRAAGLLAALLTSKLPQDVCSGPARGGLAPWQKRKLVSFIEDRLEGPVLVKELAELVSLSNSHFCRAFKQSFGETPHAYITRTRMERARKLMLTTLESLSEIAVACGLADQAHLCRCFRQATGMTPGAWRRSHVVRA